MSETQRTAIDIARDHAHSGRDFSELRHWTHAAGINPPNRDGQIGARAGAGDDVGRTDRAAATARWKVHIGAPRIKSGSANPAPKLATVAAGMCAGADCIDDIDVVHTGGMKALFDGVYAPSTIEKLLREFTFGHARQLESVLSATAMCCYGKRARKFLS